MSLIHHADLDADAVAYRLFGIGRDTVPWTVADVLSRGELTREPERSHLSWRLASRGYWTEQAGLVAAASLAAQTSDAALRFSLATATSDEARHADAFLTYARAVGGGEPDDCAEELEPLHDTLESLPYLGKALVHTLLEGFAADEFLLLRQLFPGDPLAELYLHVRRDEIRHVAIGLSYLARESRSPAGRDQWRAHAGDWLDAGMDTTGLAALCQGLGTLLGRDPAALERWFLRRHAARLRSAGIPDPRGGDTR